ncbi:MAG: pilus biosynthesis protein PilB [Actinomycetia bacterium]|nr:pilus biosynthesis protein PilB [Actinomycetes bacterium]
MRPIRRKNVDIVVEDESTVPGGDPEPGPGAAAPESAAAAGPHVPEVPEWFRPGDILPPHEQSETLSGPSITPSAVAGGVRVWEAPPTPSRREEDAVAAGPSDAELIASRAPLPMRLGDMLVASGRITAEQLDLALTEQVATGFRLGTQLVIDRAVTERDLIEMLAQQLQVPIVDLRETVPTAEAIALLPEALARRYEVVPLRKTPAGLELAVADLLDGKRVELEAGAGLPIVQVLATPSEIRYAIDQAYLALAGVDDQVRAFESVASSRPKADTQRLIVDANAPIVQVVMLIITQAVRDRASDIHIEPKEDRVRVRYRVDGVLRDATSLPDSMGDALVSRIKVMANMNIVERRRSQDGQITTMIDGRPLDIRVATTSTIYGEKAVLRLLDKTRGLRNLNELGMTARAGSIFRDLTTSPFGMVICAGPTGSGKTTTLYAALNEIDTPERNITTIEDPVEYVLPTINQIQVNVQAGITFADGLKSILRQDPDVILVGEIRDVETARIAVQSALTGHLVLSSLHATDAVTALQRLRDMGIEPFLITSSLLAIEAQRLVRCICPHCREPYVPTEAELTFFHEHSTRTKDEFWHGAGCNICSHTGYSARVGVYEILQMTEPIRRLVMEDAGHDELRDLAIAEGMSTLSDEAMRLISDDVTTIAEVIRSVYVS